jgi:hypothetical protein
VIITIVDKCNVTVKKKFCLIFPNYPDISASNGVITGRLVPVAAGTGGKLSDIEPDQDVHPVLAGRVQFQTTT